MAESSTLTCIICGNNFERRGSRGPIPKYCSQKCITRSGRTEHRKEYERKYRMTERMSGKRKQYEYKYNRRPDVKARNAARMRVKWHEDSEYRARQLARWANPYANVAIPAPYTGHRWLDMAREAVTKKYVNPLMPWSDDYYDDMGEAVLALLEGRDPNQAVKEYRSKEWKSRNYFIRMGDWGDDEDEQRKFFEKVMPQVESAEDTFLSQYVEAPFNQVSMRRRKMKHKTQQPSRRRRKDAGWQKHL